MTAPNTAAPQPDQTMRRARRSPRPCGHTDSNSHPPPSIASPAKEIQRTTTYMLLVLLFTAAPPTATVLSAPFPTTKRIVPATGCESADSTR